MQKNMNHGALYHNCKLPKKLKVDIRACMVQCIVYLIDKSLLGDGNERLKLQR